MGKREERLDRMAMPADRPGDAMVCRGRWDKACRAAAVAAAVAAGAMCLSLSVRPLVNADLGFHLAFGDRFWDRGEIVTDDYLIYPPSTAAAAVPGDLPPGCYYDNQGRFRFVRCNWLFQVLLAGVHRAGGWNALNALRIAVIAVILALQAGILRRLGVSLGWLGLAWAGTAVCSYERFMMRPELLGYACVMAHLWLLCGPITWRRVAAAAIVQVLAANLHGYWLLDAGIVGALASEASLRAAWAKWRTGQPVPPDLRKRWTRLAACLGLVLAAPLVSPGGWRTWVFPFQVVAMLRKYHIAGASAAPLHDPLAFQSLHPWAFIEELYGPFTLMNTWATYAFIVLLAAGAIAVALLLWRRRWALAAVACGFLGAALSMRRNIAPAAMVVWPLIVTAAGLALARSRPPATGASAKPAGGPGLARLAALVLLAAACLAGVFYVATNRFYVDERREWRFGWGASALFMPLGPCRWIDTNVARPQPAFADFNSSSNTIYLARKITALPCLTNTWSMPYSRMSEVLALEAGREDPRLLDRWGLDLVVLKAWPQTAALARELAESPQWALVYFETWYMVFLRRTAENAPVIAANEITRAQFDVERYIASSAKADPVPAMALKAAGNALQLLGWYEHAEKVWRACIAQRDDLQEAWLNLGVCLARRAEGLRASGSGGWGPLLIEARDCFRRALAIKKDYSEARQNLQLVEQSLQAAGLGR